MCIILHVQFSVMASEVASEFGFKKKCPIETKGIKGLKPNLIQSNSSMPNRITKTKAKCILVKTVSHTIVVCLNI